jgi:thiol-disulfide isomerase/thioredoxin
LRQLLGLLLAVSAAFAGAQELRPWSGGLTPPLAIRDLDGGQHRLQDYRGKVVLVNFWATWCEPCREEMPSINRLRTSLAGQPFAVLAVNLAEPESRIRRFMEKVPMDFTVLLDRDTSVAKTWRARILPASYLVAPDGRIRYSALGEIDWSKENVRKLIVEMLPSATGK